MNLILQLVVDDLEHATDLMCQASSFNETVAVEDDLRDELHIRHHHGNLAEQGSQVVGKRSSAHEEWIHRDEGCAVTLELQNGGVDLNELLFLQRLRRLNRNDVLRDD